MHIQHVAMFKAEAVVCRYQVENKHRGQCFFLFKGLGWSYKKRAAFNNLAAMNSQHTPIPWHQRLLQVLWRLCLLPQVAAFDLMGTSVTVGFCVAGVLCVKLETSNSL